MKVREYMTVDVTTVTATTTVTGAAQLMRSSGVRHLPVLHAGELVGIVSDRDLLGAHDEAAQLQRVSTVMSSPVNTVDADQPLADAVRTILSRRISALPVLEDGRLAGILTTTDCLLALQHEPQRDR